MRRVLIVLACCLAVAAALDTALWLWAEHRLEAGVGAWAAARRVEGWRAAHGRAKRGGWPLAASLTLADVSLAGGTPDTVDAVAWEARSLALQVSLLAPQRLRLAAGGEQRLRLGALPPVPYTAARLEAVLPLSGDTPPHEAGLVVKDLRAALPPDGAAATLADLTGHVAWAPGAGRDQPAVSASLRAEAIELPAGRSPPLGRRISSVSFDAALEGPLPRASGAAATAAAWRDAGGTLVVQRLAFGWGPLGVDASGLLGLDATLQPTGRMDARVLGYQETLDALAAAGDIPPGAAVAAKAVLGLLAESEAGGAVVALPLTLDRGTLATGRIPLAQLPPVTWPLR